MTRYELLKFQAFGIVAQGTIKCAFPDCGLQAIDILHLDHIRNDGVKHRGNNRASGTRLYPMGCHAPQNCTQALAGFVCEP